jgi:hypothetical protein
VFSVLVSIIMVLLRIGLIPKKWNLNYRLVIRYYFCHNCVRGNGNWIVHAKFMKLMEFLLQ